MSEWRNVRNNPPPENVVVEVMNNDGTQLVKQGNLWFFPDFSMYVYYTPEWWRPVDG